MTVTLVCAALMLAALVVAFGGAEWLVRVVRDAKSEGPQGRVTSSPVIRPHHVRPSGAPMDWRDSE